MLVASGDIYLPETEAEGVFMADGKIITPEMTNSIQYEGIFVANRFELNNQFSSKLVPAEKFIYRADFLINAPALVSIGSPSWQELAP